ncbi:MAG: azurin [Akkermansiaceae bacterium]|jgi:azurin
MKQLTTTLFAAALSLAPASLLAEPAAPAAAEKKSEKKADFEVTVTCNDQMQFDKKAIEVPAGKVVKLTLKNVGKVPKIAMGHNFVLLKKGTDLTAWAMKAMTAKPTDYMPTAEADKKAIIAHTKLLGPGEEDSITFTIKEAGDYEYLCSFPGHFALMKGKITAK